jgi:transcription antitermination factor NusG
LRRRKSQTWVILELSSKGEEEAKQGTLSSLIEREIGIKSEDIFVPVIKVGMGEPIFLIEGYIFIKTKYAPSLYWEIKRTPYVTDILSNFDPNTSLISTGVLTDTELKEMVGKADSLGGVYSEGDTIRVKAGYFNGMIGEVVDVIRPSTDKKLLADIVVDSGNLLAENLSQYVVLLSLRSAEVLITLDCFSIEGV